jgi:spore coat protein H
MVSVKLKFILVLLFATLLSGAAAAICLFMTGSDELKLADKGKTIENSISFFTSESNYESLKLVGGEKIILKDTKVIVNGDTLMSEEINTRGGSSLLFRRKSYSFSLKSEVSFRHGEKNKTLKKFYAIGLSMDKNYTNNRLAFEMMEKIGLFNLFYSFSELRINGISEGICMVVERPEDWAIKKKNSPLIIRRGYFEKVDKMQYSKTIDKEKAKEYSGYFKKIYKSLNKYEGEELYKTLSQFIDLDNYMRWLAFNFVVKNGDYTDEVFFYIDPAINKFNIIPWDYDDLFLTAPHEGMVPRKKILGEKLIFSSEDKLDVKIASDPYLYQHYLGRLKEIVNQLPADMVKEIFENTYAELYPYYSSGEIISMSQFDSHKDTNISGMEKDMRSLCDQLNMTFEFYRNYLKGSN